MPEIKFIDLTKSDFSLKELPENAPSHAKTLGYLQDLVKRYKNGEVNNLTVIALLKNGKASIWLPASIEQDVVDDLYDPIISVLRDSADATIN